MLYWKSAGAVGHSSGRPGADIPARGSATLGVAGRIASAARLLWSGRRNAIAGRVPGCAKTIRYVEITRGGYRPRSISPEHRALSKGTSGYRLLLERRIFLPERALAKILSAGNNGPATSHEPPALITVASASELVEPPQSALLRDAIRCQRKVAISYEDAQGSLSNRTIWPIAIVCFDDVRVLAAWCEHRSAFRHFRVDRMQVRTILEERYPGRRQSIMTQWRQQDRDWRSLLTVSDTSTGYQ